VKAWNVGAKPKHIVHLLTRIGDPFDEFMESLKDATAFSKINIRLKRVAQGNFGDHGPVGLGVLELREHYGPGYRVYFGQDGDTVIRLTGGTKKTQARDIARARNLWMEYEPA
jgi:putative addiction module killer protein